MNYSLEDSTCVVGAYDTLNELLEVVENIDKNKIMSFAFEDGWTEDKVRRFVRQINTYHSKLQLEKHDLEMFSRTFNKKFATDNNECFSTVETLFSKIQKTLKNSMKIFLNFSHRAKMRMPYVGGRRIQLPAYRGSGLGLDYRQLLIPFIETDIVSPAVKDLCEITLDFFVDVRESLSLCRKVIRQEARIRKNPSKLSSIFQSCYDEVYRLCEVTIETLKKMDDYSITDPMVKEINEPQSIEKCLANRFHTQTESEFMQFVIQDSIYKAKKEDLNPLEEVLWGGDWNKITKVRLAIKYFDEMNPQGSINNKKKRHRLKRKSVAMLMNWCGINDEDRLKGTFMKYFKKAYKGNYLQIRENTVYEAFNNWEEDEYKEFEKELNHLVEEKRQKEEKAA